MLLTVKFLRISSGGVDVEGVQALYTNETGATAPTDAPSVAPTAAPTGVPSAAPSAAPSVAPTSAPTYVLGLLATYGSSVAIAENMKPASLLRVIDSLASIQSVLVAPEVATITCTPSNDSAVTLVARTPITIDANGVIAPAGRVGFDVVATKDMLQHDQRTAAVECAITSTNNAKNVASFVIAVAVRGVTQPSIAQFCRNASHPNTCASSLTTNGGSAVEVIGGTCETCPQPPFEVRSTVVFVNGIQCNTTVLADGKVLRFTTPSLLQMQSVGNFAFHQYYTVKIRTDRGSLRALPGEVVLGPDAGDTLTCAKENLCPPGAPKTSGAFYIKRCLDFSDPTADTRWNTTTDPDTAKSFAYGVPPHCRTCPEGCRCPGGNRCHTIEGYFIDSEVLPAGDATGPVLCHPDKVLAKQRCKEWTASIGKTECAVGYTGERCGECDESYYRDDTEEGACNKCPASGDIRKTLVAIVSAFIIIALAAFILVAIVQTAFGRDIKSGHVRSARFAGWIVAALATQAQIGRTGSDAQPNALRQYYKLLQLFEANPNGAVPLDCAGATNDMAVLVMAVSIVCALLFMLLSLRKIQLVVESVFDLLRKVLAPILKCMKKKKKKKKTETNGTGEEDENDDEEVAGHNPFQAKLIEMTIISGGTSLTRRHNMGLRLEQARKLVIAHREEFASAEKKDKELDKTKKTKKKGCCKKKKKGASKKKPEKSRKLLGVFRKMLAGTVIVLHPLVANTAFKSVHCVQHGDNPNFVLASAPSVGCFGEEHVHVWLLAVVSIAVTITLFPMYVLLALSDSAKWCDRCKKRSATMTHGKVFGKYLQEAAGEDEQELDEFVFFDADFKDDTEMVAIDLSLSSPRLPTAAPPRTRFDTPAAPLNVDDVVSLPSNIERATADKHTGAYHKRGGTHDKGPGPVSGGLFCKHHYCTDVLHSTRDAFDTKHDKILYPERREAYLAFTKGEYKPEYFYVRLIFFAAITLLAFANAFVNPDLMLSGRTWTPDRLIVATQLFRHGLCASAVTVPSIVLIALQPMKPSAMWKFPLRVMCALVSLGMLTLNLAAWWVKRAKMDQKTSWIEGDALDAVSYIVLAMSITLNFGIMPVFFVIFVVFRGAHFQKKAEEATERNASEEVLLTHLEAYLQRKQRKRILAAWLETVQTQRARKASMEASEDVAALAAAGDALLLGAAESAELPIELTRADSPHFDYSHIACGESSASGDLDALFASSGTVRSLHDGHVARSNLSAQSNPLVGVVPARTHTLPGDVPWSTTAMSGVSTHTTATPMFTVHDEGEDAVDEHEEAMTTDEHESQVAIDDDARHREAVAGMHVFATAEATEPSDSSSSENEEAAVAETPVFTPRTRAPTLLVPPRKKKKKKKKKRFTFDKKRWTARNITVCDVLLDDHFHDDCGKEGEHLRELFDMLFRAGDKKNTGLLSTLDLTFLLQERAKGTALDGNALAIFSLKQNCVVAGRGAGVVEIGDRVTHPRRGLGNVVAIQADDEGKMRTHVLYEISGEVHRYLPSSWSKMEQEGQIEVDGEVNDEAFAKGLRIAIRRDPNGAVAQWILKELMDESGCWYTAYADVDARDGSGNTSRVYYIHDVDGRTQWTKPAVVEAAERIHVGVDVGVSVAPPVGKISSRRKQRTPTAIV